MKSNAHNLRCKDNKYVSQQFCWSLNWSPKDSFKDNIFGVIGLSSNKSSNGIILATTR